MAISEDAEYGVTPNGFVRMRLPEIRKNLFDKLDAKLGTAVSRKANSVIGILIGVIAEESDRQWELAEYDYYARSPVTADDGSIDNTIIYANVMRKTAQATYLYITCYGRNNTALPINCQVKDTNEEKYNISEASTITLDNCVSVTLGIGEVYGGKVYTYLLNGKNRVTYTAASGDNAERVLLKLMELTKGDWSARADVNNNLVLERTERKYGGTVVPSEAFTIIEVGTPVIFTAENTGALKPELGSVKTINTVYDGWYSCNNETEAYVGRDKETVTELRQRYAAAVYEKSVSMKESLKAGLLALQSVDNVVIYENRSDVEVDGLKPHSYLAIVHGGDEKEIAKTLLDKAPLGIDSNGEIDVEITDDEGAVQVVSFSRPKEISIWVKIFVHEYKEEKLPGDMINTIKEVVKVVGDELEMGKDVIPQRFIGPVYQTVSGIGYLDITISKDGYSYTEKSIAIGRDEIATFNVERVTVAMALDGE